MYNLAQMIIFCLPGCDSAAAEAAADSAVNLLSQAAENGHTASERELGPCLYHGVGVDRDLAAAVAHYRSAAAAGDAAAMYSLGWRYYKGEGTPRSLREAERCFAAAAEGGHAEAAKAVKRREEMAARYGAGASPRETSPMPQRTRLNDFALSRGIAAAQTGQSDDEWRAMA